jgi:hypothetical protein
MPVTVAAAGGGAAEAAGETSSRIRAGRATPPRKRANVVRTLFAVAAAIAAASATDPIVEALSNSGFFGPGRFTDHSSVDVVPAAILAALICLAVVIFRARESWMRQWAPHVGARSLPRMLPAIFIIQIAALFAMESLEQNAVYGHPLGGALWLGGPALFSLLLHAVGCILTTFGLARLLRAAVRGVVRVVLCIATLLASSISQNGCIFRRFMREFVAGGCLLTGPNSGRAPPALQTVL